jgi:hypothetical protein
MAVPVSGLTYSSSIVGPKYNAADDLKELVPGQTVFLNSTMWPGTDMSPRATTARYFDDAYTPLRTTVGTTMNSTITTCVFSAAIFKPDQIVNCQGETILLGTSSDNLTFTGCTRSVGTPAGAAHSAGVPVTLVTTQILEGEVAGSGDVYLEPRTVTTYPQIFKRIPYATDVADRVEKYGRSESQFDLEVRNHLRDIKIEMENALMMGTAQAPASTTVGKFAGFWERVVGTNTTAMGTADFTMAALRTAVDAINDYYDPGMEITAQLYVPLRQTHIFTDWQSSHIVVPAGDAREELYGIRVQRLRIGPMLIDIIPYTSFYDQAALVQPQYIKWQTFEPLYFEMLARDGLRKKGQIAYQGYPEIGVPEAHYTFSGLAV